MNRDVCEHFNPVDLPCVKCSEKRKSEALFLADELEIPLGTVISSEIYRRSAAEMRRLQAINEELLTLAHQYANDMRYPPKADSRQRRLAAVEAVLAKVKS